MADAQGVTRRITGKITKIVMMVVILLPLFVLIFGEAVRYLWNWLMPTLFHLPVISFWQALGILVLSWLLFGGLRGRGHRGGFRRNWRRRMEEHWENMSPDEREKFRAWVQSRCGAQPE